MIDIIAQENEPVEPVLRMFADLAEQDLKKIVPPVNISDGACSRRAAWSPEGLRNSAYVRPYFRKDFTMQPDHENR
jgi:hypothetical protein